MKKVIAVLAAIFLCLSVSLPVCAAEGKVTYSANAGDFVFAPGSEHSLTDLFPNFKGVMPGDTLTQQITVKNDADNKVKVKIYIRSLGAHENSAAFLSQLGLQVNKSADNEMGYMFDASAGDTAQLTDWVCLGTLYSGGEVNLDVTLQVPKELDNTFQSQIGYLDWEFKVEEYPVADTDPKPPQTGDSVNVALYGTAMTAAAAFLLLLWFHKKKTSSQT